MTENPISLPDVIQIPNTETFAYSGKWIVEKRKMVIENHHTNGKLTIPADVISLEGDGKFDNCLAYAKSFGEALRAKDSAKLHELILSNNEESKKYKVHLSDKDADAITQDLLSNNRATQERALGYVYVIKMNNEAGSYDKGVEQDLKPNETSIEFQRRLMETGMADEKSFERKNSQFQKALDTFAIILKYKQRLKKC